MDDESRSVRDFAFIRPEVAKLGEEAVTLLETLTELVVGKAPPPEMKDGAVWYLTICGMLVTQQHARGSVAEFAAGRSYSGAALDRCMFEGMVRTVDWNLRPSFAFECWKAVPVFAAREEVRRIGGKPRASLLQNTDIPAGVQRDIAAYLASAPEAEKTREADFIEAAQRAWPSTGANAAQTQTDVFNHYDTPSLFVHCRALVSEDVFDVSNDEEWAIRDVSRMAEPNARVLEIVRLLTRFCRFVAPRFGYETSAVDRVDSLRHAVSEEHERLSRG